MNKLTILCSINGWKTTRNVNMVQTTGESNVYEENVTTFDQPTEQLDCFFVSVNATDIGEAVTFIDGKLNELTEELRIKFGDFEIHEFDSYPVSCS